jgi:hypothetical protein
MSARKNMTSLKKILKITTLVTLSILLALYGGLHFLSYKIKQESKYINQINYYVHMSKDLHTLCMLDYMINPNGKDMLEQCKEIAPKIKTKQEKSLTPYYDFYKTYLREYIPQK